MCLSHVAHSIYMYIYVYHMYIYVYRISIELPFGDICLDIDVCLDMDICLNPLTASGGAA